MAPPEIAALLVPGRVLSADDVLALSAALEPAWKARQRRLEARAVAIRAAMAATGTDGPMAAACALARALDAISRGRPCANNALSDAGSEVLRLNDGRPLNWRTILRAAKPTAEH